VEPVDRVDEDERRRRAHEAIQRYWANITPEQRAERLRKAAETRAATKAMHEECAHQERLKAERAKKARERARARRGDPIDDSWHSQWLRDKRRRDRFAAARTTEAVERARRRKELVDAVTKLGDNATVNDFLYVDTAYRARRSETFWQLVDTSAGPDACWPWHGDWRFRGTSDYGETTWHGRRAPAHVVAWMLSNGREVPPRWVVDHMCSCKWCVNPAHLDACTGAENRRRIHRRTPEFTRARTSWEKPTERWRTRG
jgi:hypothetical protein